MGRCVSASRARSSCASAKGDTWQDVPFDDPPQEFRNEWRSFVDAITLDIEPPSDGAWGRHIMEILFAAENRPSLGTRSHSNQGAGG